MCVAVARMCACSVSRGGEDAAVPMRRPSRRRRPLTHPKPPLPPGLPTPPTPRPAPPSAGDDAASLFSRRSSTRGPPSLGQRVCAALPYLVPFIDVVAMGIEALRTVPQLTWVHDLPSECCGECCG